MVVTALNVPWEVSNQLFETIDKLKYALVWKLAVVLIG
jgi:hypothetical protein